MFIGRKAELKQLNEQYNSSRFEFAVIYGRRRIGKTSLIQEFIKDKKALFFTGLETTQKQNLVNLSQVILQSSLDDITFNSFQAALENVFEKAKKERIIFVIDEYPYLANTYPAISSILQLLIDKNKEDSKLFLILCGSSLSFMEEQVLGYQSPLYGRRTSQYKIKPFSFFETCDYFNSFSYEEKAFIYGLTSGIPLYISLFRENKSLKQNIIDIFLSSNGYLFEEPTNLIKQECRDPSTYNSIIQAIATGATKLSEISNQVGIETGLCTTYIKKLISLGIIIKDYPIYKPSKKQTIYLLEDHMFQFWYKFILPNISLINIGMGEKVYEKIEPHFYEFMGYIFEDICKQYLWLLNIREELPLFFLKLGRWWGNDPRIKAEAEIDILAYNDENQILLGECKWRNEEIDKKVLEKAIFRSELFSFPNKFIYLFSKTGFTSYCLEYAKTNPSIHLVTFQDIIKAYESNQS
nr:ATP-binding protein [uncultured Faecalibacillus sp.]